MPAKVDLKAADINAVPAVGILRPEVLECRLGTVITMCLAVHVDGPGPHDGLAGGIVPASAFDPADRLQQTRRQPIPLLRRGTGAFTRFGALSPDPGGNSEDSCHHEPGPQPPPRVPQVRPDIARTDHPHAPTLPLPAQSRRRLPARQYGWMIL